MAPILQVAIGRFDAASTEDYALAVLHPRELAVYRLVTGEQAGKSSDSLTSLAAAGSSVVPGARLGRSCKRQWLYSHQLGKAEGVSFTAHSMTIGAFGNPAERDKIAVQSMDGQIAIFEKDRYAFTRQLEDVLLPGPLCYVARIDSFVTIDSTMHLRAFRYSALAGAVDSRPTASSTGPAATAAATTEGATGGRRLRPAWSINLGEEVRILRPCRLSPGLMDGETDILAVGLRTLFLIKERGPSASGATGSAGAVVTADPFRLQLRLDHPPACACVFRGDGAEAPENPPPLASSTIDGGERRLVAERQRLLLATHARQLRVYAGSRLVWTSRTPASSAGEDPPVAVSVGTFGGLAGLVVSLFPNGHLVISYMGTDPPTTSAVAIGAQGRELDYDAIDREHQSLLRLISDSQGEGSADSQRSARLVASLAVPDMVEPCELAGGMNGSEPGLWRSARIECRALLTFTSPKADESASNVRICVTASASAAIVSPSTWRLASVPGGGGEPVSLPFTVTGRVDGLPSDLALSCVVTYTNASGAARVARCDSRLPLALVARVVPPVKIAKFRLTLDAPETAPTLGEVFADLLAQPTASGTVVTQTGADGGQGYVLSLHYNAGSDVTLLASSKTGRVRLQAGSLEALQLAACETARRLGVHGRVGYTEPLPLADVLGSIDAHWEARRQQLAAHAGLNDRAQQLRLIQKRLLTRFRDRTPAPLAGLDRLLDATFAQILEDADSMDAASAAVALTGARLQHAIRLFVLLASLRYKLSAEAADVLAAHLPAEPQDSLEQGWEERADAGIAHLLRIMNGKVTSGGLGAGAITSTSDAPALPESTVRIRKHLELLVEALEGGKPLIVAPRPSASAAAPAVAGAPQAKASTVVGAAAAGAGASEGDE